MTRKSRLVPVGGYPVKPIVDAETGARYTIISIRLPDGSYIAGIAEDDWVTAQSNSRLGAEQRVMDLYLDRLERPKGSRRNRAPTQAERDAIEDELDLQEMRKARGEKGTIRYDRKRYGV